VLVRSILFNIAFLLTFVVLGILFSPILLFPSRYGWWVVHIWADATLWWHKALCGIGEEIRGRENIPPGGLIVASKHQSAWETLRLVTLFPKPTFILKRELMWIPLFGWYLKRFGQIPIDRGRRSEALQAMTNRTRAAVAEGRQVIIFPEGTRRHPLAPPDYKFGVARLYRAVAATVLPIALDSGLFWPRRSLAHRPGKIVLACLPAIPPGKDADVFFADLKAALETASAALVTEAFAHDRRLEAAVKADLETQHAG
jgi:1-acyl-sn-glycerol-3-phosphate acyltransferase